ncbi:MAG: SH3 domain-containing protein [Clostridia bacterium]|nr:SH3 domain-containing protein [Clostridia bacterium]
MKKRIISVLAALVMVVGIAAGAIFGGPDSSALAPSGIMNNGLNGIYININAAPYTTLAETTSYAYRRGGCAWFASSRARELTGKNISIHGPSNWWNTYYANYGFTKGYTPRAKCFAIYTNHMLVVERIDGSVITVSEGATPQSDADHGYCIIYTTTREKLEGNNGGEFVGYIYLNVGAECNTNGTTTRTNWWNNFFRTTTTTTRYNTTRTTTGAITTTPNAPAGGYTTGNYLVNTGSSNLNIRSAPGDTSTVLGRIPGNTTIYVSQVNGNWGRVTYDGVTGWVSLDWCYKQ